MDARDLRMRFVSADVVRSLIAEAVLSTPDIVRQLGSVTLWDHQREAVARVRPAIGEFGGALLADEVGLGKTYVALAVAASYAAPIVVAPAALRDTWERAFASTRSRSRWISLESLSRRVHDGKHDLVIVDEAHHARNPDTRRYRSLARLCASAHVLLLSATPVHNTASDLSALLALFLGSHVETLDAAALARIVVRRTRRVVQREQHMPRVRPTVSIDCADDAAVAEAILLLPAPIPLRDGGTADALLAFTLLRQWASSVGALRAAITRRLGRTQALADALRSGRLPSRADVEEWIIGDDAQQLAFAELLVPAMSDSRHEASAHDLLVGATQHEHALRTLLASLGDAPDVGRVDAMRQIIAAHPEERVLAFSQFSGTIASCWRLMRTMPGVCALTASGGHVAGGRISRAEAIARFAPIANGAPPPRAADRIRVLLTTDILSEGINLQDASVIVHLDLPWTAARLEQRVGRVARAGSPHDAITVYSMAPPASSEAAIAIQRRLREKLALATTTVGTPSFELFDHPASQAESPSAAVETLRDTVRRWPIVNAPHASHDWAGVRCAVLRGRDRGWLALLDAGPSHRIVACLEDRVGTDVALVATVASLCEHAPSVASPLQDSGVAWAVTGLQRWLGEERAAALAGITEMGAFRRRRSALRQLSTVDSLPRVRRAALDSLASAARSLATSRMSRGAEQSLLAVGNSPDQEAWLRRLAALAGSGQKGASNGVESSESVVALLVLVAE